MRTSCPFLAYESRLGPIQGRLIAPTPANGSAMNRVRKLQSGNRTTRRLAAAIGRGRSGRGPAQHRGMRTGFLPSSGQQARREVAPVTGRPHSVRRGTSRERRGANMQGRRGRLHARLGRRAPPEAFPSPTTGGRLHARLGKARRTRCGVPYRNSARHVSPSPCRLATLSLRLSGSCPNRWPPFTSRHCRLPLPAPHSLARQARA